MGWDYTPKPANRTIIVPFLARQHCLIRSAVALEVGAHVVDSLANASYARLITMQLCDSSLASLIASRRQASVGCARSVPSGGWKVHFAVNVTGVPLVMSGVPSVWLTSGVWLCGWSPPDGRTGGGRREGVFEGYQDSFTSGSRDGNEMMQCDLFTVNWTRRGAVGINVAGDFLIILSFNVPYAGDLYSSGSWRAVGVQGKHSVVCSIKPNVSVERAWAKPS